MIKALLKTKFILIFAIFFLLFNVLIVSAGAGSDTEFQNSCNNAFGIPERCREEGAYEPDFNCINNKFVDPSNPCCINKCKDNSSPSEPLDERLTKFKVFSTTISLDFSNSNTIPTIVNLLISTVLGVISLYVLFRGIYVAAFKRTVATDSAEIQKITLELRNLLIGFILAWGAIFIVQIVANAIGLGSLNDLQISGSEDAYVITIR